MRPPTMYVAAIACVVAGYLSHASGADIYIARAVYNHFGGFPRNAVFLKDVMHEGLRTLATVLLAGLALVLAVDAFSPRRWLAPWRAPLRLFAVCAAVFIGGVAVLKSQTTPACPWDLAMFGGTKNPVGYGDLFNVARFGKGRCFPAGHSTSGYVWLGLAFLLTSGPRSFYTALLALLPVGMALSAAQILRGAHFLSHELTTLGLALLVFSVLPRVLFSIRHFSSKSLRHDI